MFNRTIASATLDFKDIVVYSESNEYLKRLYYIKNSAGRNEIYDRIRMLAGNSLSKPRFLLRGRHAEVRAPHDDHHENERCVSKASKANEKDDCFRLLITIVIIAQQPTQFTSPIVFKF